MQGSRNDVKVFKTTSRDANICKCKLDTNLFDKLCFRMQIHVSCLLAFVSSLSALQLSTTFTLNMVRALLLFKRRGWNLWWQPLPDQQEQPEWKVVLSCLSPPGMTTKRSGISRPTSAEAGQVLLKKVECTGLPQYDEVEKVYWRRQELAASRLCVHCR